MRLVCVRFQLSTLPALARFSNSLQATASNASRTDIPEAGITSRNEGAGSSRAAVTNIQSLLRIQPGRRIRPPRRARSGKSSPRLSKGWVCLDFSRRKGKTV